ncbi:MAG: hypothetical protein RI953_2274 [Pseudomonadota bacterium]|jgi:hypothetical protein
MNRENLRCRSFITVLFVFLFLAFNTSALAGGKAHEHGVASVNIVAEGNSLTIQFEAPADGIYGFEHEAKSPADIKKRDVGVDKLKTNGDKMFLPAVELNCKAARADVKPFVVDSNDTGTPSSSGKKKSKKGSHGEVHAVFKFDCSKPLTGSKLSFAVGEYFKSIRTLRVQVLSGNLQEGSTIKNDKGSVNL